MKKQKNKQNIFIINKIVLFQLLFLIKDVFW